MNTTIDLHSHWFSPTSIRLLSERSSNPRVLPDSLSLPALHCAGAGTDPSPFTLEAQWFDLDLRIAHLDQVGVQYQLISWPTTLGLDAALSASESLPIWRAYNDELAAAVRHHPQRLGGLAALSTADIRWSVDELQRAHDELGLLGAVLPINGFASLAGARHFAPLFERAQRLGSHIYLHTGYAHPSVAGQPPVLLHSDSAPQRYVLDVAWQFAAATLTLAYTDFLDDYPDVTVQIAMLGGAAIVANLAELGQQDGHFAAVGPQGRFSRLFFDTGAAGSGSRAMALAARVFGAEQIVFGSDYAPLPDITPILENLERSGLNTTEQQAIRQDNALRLLGKRVPGLVGQRLSGARHTSTSRNTAPTQPPPPLSPGT